MTLEEMRWAHEAATGGEWVGVDVAYVSTADGRFNVADCADAEAIVVYHNKFAKLLAVAEAAKALDGLDVWRHANLLNARLATLFDALAALEES